MPADSNNQGLGPTGNKTGTGQPGTNDSPESNNKWDPAKPSNSPSNTSGVISADRTINNKTNTGKSGNGKTQANTADNENTTEADLVLNEDLNSNNDI